MIQQQQRIATIQTRQKTPVSYAFTYLNSPNTVRQYPKRLELFFEFVGLQGENLEQQGQAFIDETKKEQGQQWAQEQIIMYIDSLKKRVKQNTSNEHNKTNLVKAISIGGPAYFQCYALFAVGLFLPLTPSSLAVANSNCSALSISFDDYYHYKSINNT